VTYRLQFRRYRLPFRSAVNTGHGRWAEREGVLVRLENAAGQAGYGEAAPIPWFGTETVDEAAAVCGDLGVAVDDARLDALPVRLGCLRNALAAARAELGRGGASPKPDGLVNPPSPGGVATGNAPYLPVAALLPAGRAALAQVVPKSEAGFRTFKWKVGVGDVADELGLLDDLCGALPGGAKLRLDANGAWNRRQAERWLERCADRPVEFVEQPAFAPPTESETVRRRTDDLLQGLAHDFPTPIALDESLSGEGAVERWLRVSWPGVFVIKPALLGDVPATLAALAKAKAAVVFSSALETRVGAAAALRAAFGWPGEVDPTGVAQPRALGFGVWPLFADGRFDGPHTGPFLQWEDVARIDPEAVWNALS
jgi:O-succinylbenzoate synthase